MFKSVTLGSVKLCSQQILYLINDNDRDRINHVQKIAREPAQTNRSTNETALGRGRTVTENLSKMNVETLLCQPETHLR